MTLLVRDYDKAIAYYVEKLKFQLVEDTRISTSKRWVLVRPPGSSGCYLLLAKAVNEQQALVVGNHSGGRVFLFLNTDNFKKNYNQMLDYGVQFVRKPLEEAYGTLQCFRISTAICGT